MDMNLSLGLVCVPGILLHFFLLLSFVSSNEIHPSEVVFTYSRIPEIKTQCSSYLSSASKLEPDDYRVSEIGEDLSFSGGEWEQETLGLMRFDDSDIPWIWTGPIPDPLKFVGFSVKDIRPAYHLVNAVSLGGVLSIGMYRNRSLELDSTLSFGFNEKPGLSVLVIKFEGIYLRTKEGERLICMLGSSRMLSGARFESFYPFNGMLLGYGDEPTLGENDQVLLVLHYPQRFNLTSRAISGKMESLYEPGSVKYSDPVLITSQMSHKSRYEFSEGTLSGACDESPYKDEMIEDGAYMFEAADFCRNLRRISPFERFSIEPNYNFNIMSLQNIGRLGPFSVAKETKNSNFRYEDFKLILQDVRCEEAKKKSTDRSNGSTAKVSAVLRVVSTLMDSETASARSGISGTTISAEGLWNSSNGKLCMYGLNLHEERCCDSQILLYFPRSFLVTQRSIVRGSISSIRDQGEPFEPLIFSLSATPSDFMMKYTLHSTPCSYNYSKIGFARTFRDRSQQDKDINQIIKQRFLRFPRLEDRGILYDRLSRLMDDLYLDSYAFPDQFNPGFGHKFFLRMELLSVGPLCGYYNTWRYDYSLVNVSALGAEENDSGLLNVAAHLIFTEEPSFNIGISQRSVTHMFLEGLYDSNNGEMHLIGCGKVDFRKGYTERGLDCLIEAKIEYPSYSLRWLKTPKAKFVITSKRSLTDPHYFMPIKLPTRLIGSPTFGQDLAFRKVIEGILRVVILAWDIGVTLQQFSYMKQDSEIIPRISLVMVGTQVLGYAFPLISGSEMVLKSKESDSYRRNC